MGGCLGHRRQFLLLSEQEDVWMWSIYRVETGQIFLKKNVPLFFKIRSSSGGPDDPALMILALISASSKVIIMRVSLLAFMSTNQWLVKW
jgi:hypothetical protein